MSKSIITYSEDAERYVACGWDNVSSSIVVLKGTNKKYIECKLVWSGNEPVYPKGDAPDMITTPIQE